jgi:hypothetical protein
MSAISEEPIKFRCYQCNKLLGVPARKVGSIVSCPRCQAELQVPSLESAAEPSGPEIAVEPAQSPAPAPSRTSEPVPDVLSAAASASRPVVDDPLLVSIQVEPPSIRPRDEPERPTHNIVLSPIIVLAWSLLVLMAVPLAFVAGLLTGHFIWK